MPIARKNTTPVKIEPYWRSECGRAVVYVGDCRDVMASMGPDQFHAVVTDPPYGLEFMNKQWDAPWKVDGNVDAITRRADEMGDPIKAKYLRHNVEYARDSYKYQEWFFARAEAILRVAKPGAHLLSFGGTRMWHRMACAIEDAGFEVRDTIMWVYGSGFPKSRDVSKAIDKVLGADRTEVLEKGRAALSQGQFNSREVGAGGYGYKEEYDVMAPVTDAAKQWSGWGTTLKPSHEPIVVARKLMSGSVAQNTLDHGCGGVNVDGCRVGTTGTDVEKFVATKTSTGSGVYQFNSGEAGSVSMDGDYIKTQKDGRWPSNLIHDGSDEVVELFPTTGPTKPHDGDGKPLDTQQQGWRFKRTPSKLADNGGSVARFFKTCQLTEEDLKWSCNELAKDVENCFDLQSEFVASVLTHAVEKSTQRLVLQNQGVQAQNMRVSGTQLRIVYEIVIETIQNSERRYSLGLPPEKSTVRLGPVTCVATPSLTGTISITISLTTSSHSVEVVTFSIMPASSELGDQDSVKNKLHYTAKADVDDRPHGKGSVVHPTVKPLDLMHYLVRLVCAPGGTVLDPFMGSGSTGCAAVEEGMWFVGIEQSQEYADLAVGRLKLSLDMAPVADKLVSGVAPRTGTAPPPKKVR